MTKTDNIITIDKLLEEVTVGDGLFCYDGVLEQISKMAMSGLGGPVFYMVPNQEGDAELSLKIIEAFYDPDFNPISKEEYNARVIGHPV